MDERLSLAGMTRPVLILGGVYFGVFAVVAFAMQRLDASQSALSIVGGVMAYAYLMTIAGVAFVKWRRARSRNGLTEGPGGQ